MDIKPWNFFKRRYVINLKRSDDRRKSILHELEKVNMEFEFVEAVDARENYETLRKYYRQKGVISEVGYSEFTPGTLGCLLSHYKIYEKELYQHNNEKYWILIMEDDICFSNKLTTQRLKEYLQNWPEHANYVKLGYCNYLKDNTIDYNSHFQKLKNVTTFSGCYAVCSTALHFLVNKQYSKAIDIILIPEMYCCKSLTDESSSFYTANGNTFKGLCAERPNTCSTIDTDIKKNQKPNDHYYIANNPLYLCVGTSSENVKIIELPHAYPEGTQFKLDEQPIIDVIESQIKGTQLILRRTDCKSGWGYMHKGTFLLPNKPIVIGTSTTNTKIIPVIHAPGDTFVLLQNPYKDTFDFKLENNTLTVKRTDCDAGWGYSHKGMLYKTLPIERTISAPNTSKIPKILIQTYKNNIIHPALYDNTMKFLEKNKDFSYKLITDDIGTQLIQEHFDNNVLWAYERIYVGAAKGDFLRYIALYVYGGVYLDLDSGINISLKDYIKPEDEFIFFYDDDPSIEQNCFMIKPKHELLKRIIDEMVKRIYDQERNIFLATGPQLFTDVIYNTMNHTNIYNVRKTVSKEAKAECWKRNGFMGGRFVYRSVRDPAFSFKVEGYDDTMLYNNHETYHQNNVMVNARMYKPDAFPKFYVSMTTIPSRFNTIHKTIDTLLTQSYKPEKIIIQIPHKYGFRFQNATIPQSDIDTLKSRYEKTGRLIIHMVDEDYGPGTKLLGALEMAEIDDNSFIVLADDDIRYTDILHEYLPYVSKFEVASKSKSFLESDKVKPIVCGCGFATFLMKKSTLSHFRRYYDTIKHETKVKYHDDAYISYYFHLLGKEIKIVPAKSLDIGKIHNPSDALCVVEGEFERSRLEKECANILTSMTERGIFYFIRPKLFVSMTTIPSRFNTVYKTIDSLIQQTYAPEKIILNIPVQYGFRFKNEVIAQSDIDLLEERYKSTGKLLIHKVSEDYGPGTKLLGALDIQEISDNSYIVVVDDDVIYNDFFHEYIPYLNTYNVGTKSPMKYTGYMTDLPEISKRLGENVYSVQGVSSFFVKRSVLNDFKEYFSAFKHHEFVKYHDDLYISYYFYLLGQKIAQVGGVPFMKSIHDDSGALGRLELEYSRKTLNQKIFNVLNDITKRKDFIFRNVDDVMKQYEPHWSNYLKQFDLPAQYFQCIPRHTNKFCVIVEPRKHKFLIPVLKNYVFLLQSKGYGLIVFHGTENETYLRNGLLGWSNVIYENIGKPNLSLIEYNNLYTSAKFWEILIQHGCEHALTFESDTVLLKDCIDDYLEYDYIGAPWAKGSGICGPLKVGNSGFCLRKPRKMLEIIQKYGNPMGFTANDNYFTFYNFKNKNNVPSVDVAKTFGVESLFFNDPCGFHKPWISEFPVGEFERILAKRHVIPTGKKIIKMYVNGFWEGFVEKTDVCNVGFVEYLLEKTLDIKIQLSLSIQEADILLESHFGESVFHKKAWKYSIFLSGEARESFPKHIEEYTVVLGSKDSKNAISCPLYLMYLYGKPHDFCIPSKVPDKDICIIVSKMPVDLTRSSPRFRILKKLENAGFRIDYGGSYNNNIGGNVKGPYWSDETLNFYSQYKLVLALENVAQDNYITEKLINPLYAGTIPIYFGAPNVSDYFNGERMICINEENVEDNFFEIKRMLLNEKLWLEKVKQPIFKNTVQENMNSIIHNLRKKMIPIPQILHQTWKTKTLPPHMNDVIEFNKRKNPEFQFKLYDDTDCATFIERHFDSSVIDAFHTLTPGAYRADLFRYCVLFIEGGIYLDIKFKCADGFRLAELTEQQYVKDLNKWSTNAIYNALIVSKPNNPTLWTAIQTIVKHCASYFYGDNLLAPTGPVMFGECVAQETNPVINLQFSDQGGLHILRNNMPILSGYTEYNTEKYTIAPAHYYHAWKNKEVYSEIRIGTSRENTKVIPLHHSYPQNWSCMIDGHEYSDRFETRIEGNNLIVKRIDCETGWGFPHTGKIIKKHTLQAKSQIPNIIHFIFLSEQSKKVFQFTEFLSILSAKIVNNPDKIYLYVDKEPDGVWWNLIKEYIHIEKVEVPIRWADKQIHKIAHKADHIRIHKLYERGGIYFDIDTISYKPYSHLLNCDTVLGSQSPKAICNAVLMTIPKSNFFKTWIQLYEYYFKHDGWGEASVSLPKIIYNFYSDDTKIRLMKDTVFFRPSYNEINKIFVENLSIPDDLITLHLWESFSQTYLNSMNIEWIQTHPNTLYSKITKFVSKIGLGTELNSEIKIVLSKVLNLDSESIERKNIFESIYEKNVWNNADPRIPLSGPGSSMENTKNVAKLLDDFVQDAKCVSVTDLGCGDLTWMSKTSLFQNEKISYVGIDIAEPLIIKHSFAYPKKLFLNKDIVTNNDIPYSSLIIIRDVIFHLSIKDVQSIFRNIQGKFDYIAITSCNNLKNEDNFNVWHFNPRNIHIEPFCISNNFIKSCDEPVFNRKFYIYSHNEFYNQLVTQKNTIVITTTLPNNEISKKRRENLNKTTTLPIVFIQGEKNPRE